MDTNPGALAYMVAFGVILRAAFALIGHGLRRPCARAAISRDGRVQAR